MVSSSDKQELGQQRGPGPGLSDDHGTKSKDYQSSDIPKSALYRGYYDIMAPQHQAHGFAQTDTVKHCPFCGSGDVWGGSDGTITCEFDGATFQVSVEPQYPSAPGSMNGMPLNIDGQVDPNGQANAGDAWAVPDGVAPSSGEGLDMDDEGGDDEGAVQDEGAGGGPPWAKGDGDDDEEEDEDEDDRDEEDLDHREERLGFPPGMRNRRSFITFAGDALPESLYLKHLAIRHAEEPRRFLASLRTAAYTPSRGYDSYEEAAEARVPRADVEHFVRQHGHDVADMVADLGDRTHYKGKDVLDWLGY